MRKKLLAVFSALLIACSLGIVGMTASAQNNNKVAIGIQGVAYMSNIGDGSSGIVVNMGEFYDGVHETYWETFSSNYVIYTDVVGNNKLTKLETCGTSFAIRNVNPANGDKLLIKAGFSWNGKETKEDLMYNCGENPESAWYTEKPSSYIYHEALNVNKTEIIPVNVIQSSAWRAILVEMNSSIPALDNFMVGNHKNDSTNASALNFLEVDKRLITYTDSQGNDKLFSVRYREQYLFIDANGQNYEVGDKLTIKAGVVWNGYQVKQDLVYTCQGADLPFALSAESYDYQDISVNSVYLYNDTAWGAPSIDVILNMPAGITLTQYADYSANMKMEYTKANGTKRNLADMTCTDPSGRFVIRLADNLTLSNPYYAEVGDKFTIKAGSYIVLGLKAYRITEDAMFIVTNAGATTTNGGQGFSAYTPQNYTVTFNSNGGSAVSSQTVTEGTVVTKPTNPTKEATAEYTYTFNGWLLDGVAYDFTTEVTGNITLVADWTATKNTYTVTFDSNGGTAVDSQTVEYGLTFTEPTAPTKSATAEYTYTFNGWLLDGVAYDFATEVTGNITLVADWTATKNTYTVTFDSNGGTAVDGETVEYGLTFAEPTAPTKQATAEYTYTFNGWLLDGVAYDFATEVTGNITLVADWTATKNTYTVTFDSNGGTAVDGETVEYGLTFSEPTAPTKSATAEYTYTFNGWLLDGVAYDFDTTVTGNITLVADWTATKNTYTVTFDSTGGTAVDSQTVEYGLTFAEPTAPTKSATAEFTYTFNGWLLDGVAYDFDMLVTGNITLVADWTATKNSYTVTFDSNGGTAVDGATVEYGAKFSEPINPTKAADEEFTYEFAGWLLNGEAYDFNTPVTENITLVASWTEIPVAATIYTVTFDSNGGTTVSNRYVEEGFAVDRPADPTREATVEYTYEFAGWLLNGMPYNFDSAVTDNITLIAKWTSVKNTYTVTFDSNGGTAIESETKPYGMVFTKPNNPTKEATAEYTFAFAGWLLDGEDYNFETLVTGNITLVAKWNEIKNAYTVTFNTDGGTAVDSETVEYGLTFNEPIAPEKQATAEYTFTFAGWLLDGEDYNFETLVTGNITLVAKWTKTKNIYTVTYDSNGGTAVDSESKEYGSKFTMPNNPTKEATAEFSYTFAGWTLNGNDYNFGTIVTENIVLVAKWTETKNTYSVTFDANGGTAVDGETVEYGLTFSEPIAPTKSATAEYTYTFNGWLLDGEAYDFDTLVTGNITLVADWTATKNTYTVTFDSNGGSNVDGQTKEYGLTFSEPVAPEKQATAEYTYTFNGWLLDGEAYYFDTLVTEDITLIASWTATKNSYTVTFVVDGTNYSTETKEYGLTFAEPTDPIKDATAEYTYTFNGWLLDGEAYDFDTLVTENITLVADWTATKNSYTVTFVVDGTDYSTETVEYGLTFSEPVAPEKQATAEFTYTFNGWLLDGVAYEFSNEVIGNITLIADWTATKNTYTVTFDSNGGTAVASETKEYGETFTKPSDPTKSATAEYTYVFVGWTLDGEDYDFNTEITRSISLVAKWDAVKRSYTVTYDSNGGTAVESETKEYGSTFTVPTDPVKQSTEEYVYTFMGWTLNGADYDFNTMVTGNIVLVAKWAETLIPPSVYIVTFDSNGGTTVESVFVVEDELVAKPSDPTKKATVEYTYTFAGWMLNGVEYDFNTPITNDITLVAKWNEIKNTYTVTFDSNGGTAIDCETVEYGLTFSAPTAPEKQATAEYTYTFNGWLLDGVAYDFSTEVTGNITLIADWTATKNTYTVTFDSDGGSAVAPETKEYGSKFTLPANPVKSADGEYMYAFAGWFLNDVEYNFDTPVTGNIILVAKWNQTIIPPSTCVVTFNSNGGTSVESAFVTEGSLVQKPDDPTRNETAEYTFTFDCWTLNGETFDFNKPVTENIELIAKWTETKKSYTATFVVDGADYSSQTVEYGLTFSAPTAPTKTETDEFTFTFAGWTLNGADYDFATEVTGNITLVAKWTETKRSYTVTYDSNGGTAVASETKEYGSTFTTPTAPTKSATAEYTYTFNGWLLDGVAYDFDTLVTGNITLVASWTETKNSYTATFVVDGADYSSETVEYGLTFSVPTAPTKEATAEFTYTFNGWLLDGVAYDFATEVKGDITLVAKWTETKNSYTATFVVDGTDYSSQTVEYGLTFSVPTAPTKTETDEFTFTFAGWTLNGADYDFATEVTGNITLVAKWTETKRSYTVTYDSNGGTEVAPETKEYGSTFTTPTAPTKEATAEYTYTFVGWTLNGADYDFATEVTGNITLVAKWDQIPVSVDPDPDTPVDPDPDTPVDPDPDTPVDPDPDTPVDPDPDTPVDPDPDTPVDPDPDTPVDPDPDTPVDPEPEDILVTDITLSDTNVTLTVGETRKLTATIAPADATNKNIVWNSSDESVVTVDQNGNVTAVGGGTAIIFVETADGRISKGCVINVIAQTEEPKGGCGGVIGSALIPSIIALVGAGLVVAKKRKQK